MKIEGPKPGFTDEAATISDLEILLQQPAINELRPCQNCVAKCECSDSQHCACQCSVDCVNIPIALSIDPDRFPIEPGIARLVFELNALRLFQTCWSCEGHLSNGYVNKMPRIWFYTPSPTYTQLIVQHLSGLMCAHRLQFNWGVQMTTLNSEIHCTYSIEPLIDHTTQLTIEALHNDLKVISEDFAHHIKRLAKSHLRRLVQNQTANRFGHKMKRKLA